MKILITGAAGFIGAHLIRALKADNDIELMGVDSFSDFYSTQYKKMRIEALIQGHGIVVKSLDLGDFRQVSDVFQSFKPHVVIHLAAQAGVRLSPNLYPHYVNSNLNGFSNVLMASLEYETKSLLYASSSSVYGNSSKSNFSESVEALFPTSFYGATKLSNEILARSISIRHGLRTRGLRFFTVYGTWGRPDMGYFRILEALVNERTFRLNGNGQVERDFTYVSDVVEMTIELFHDLMKRQEGHTDVVNLGGGNPHSMSDLITTMENLSGKKLSIEFAGMESSDANRTSSDRTYLESVIGVRRFVSLGEGVERIIAWGSAPNIRNHLADWVDSSYKFVR